MSTTLLSMRGISKSFPGVRALDEVSLELMSGQVHVVVGENGAGKSTLLKILAGAYRADSGEMLLAGEAYQPRDPSDAIAAGISLIYQEDQLLPNLSVMENVLLGRLPRNGPLVDWPAARRRARDLLASPGVDLRPDASVARLGSAQRQMVEIARALAVQARIIVMDEPTASLSESEIERLFALIGELKQRGVGFLYVSHRLEELEQVGEVVTVLRDGRAIHSGPLRDLTRDALIRLIVGRTLDQYFPGRKAVIGEVVMHVEGLRSGDALRGVDFDLRAGEVLGVAGLVGSGRTEMARAIFGADRADAGRVTVSGRALEPGSPGAAAAAGVALVPEERKTQGLVLELSVVDNIALPNLARLSRFGRFDWTAAKADASEHIRSLNIRTRRLGTRVEELSGGNQQKVVIAKWLARRPKVLIFDEPTKGIDVGAKTEVYRVINQLAESGVGIVLISSELPEVLAMSDRIMVLRGGRVAAIVEAGDATQESIFEMAAGKRRASVA